MPSLKPINAKFSYDVGDIPLSLDAFALLNEHGVVVNALPRQNAPIVKTLRVRLQMPLAEKSRSVTPLLEQFREGHLLWVKGSGAVLDTANVSVFSCQYRCPARCAQSAGDERVSEKHSLASNSVKVRSLNDALQSGCKATLT